MSLPTMSESAKIANIHYIYQQRPNKERAKRWSNENWEGLDMN